MKITIEQSDGFPSVSSSIPDDMDIHEVIPAICGLLVAFGFHQQTVEEGILTQAEQYEADKEEVQDTPK